MNISHPTIDLPFLSSLSLFTRQTTAVDRCFPETKKSVKKKMRGKVKRLRHAGERVSERELLARWRVQPIGGRGGLDSLCAVVEGKVDVAHVPEVGEDTLYVVHSSTERQVADEQGDLSGPVVSPAVAAAVAVAVPAVVPAVPTSSPVAAHGVGVAGVDRKSVVGCVFWCSFAFCFGRFLRWAKPG